MNMRFLLMAVGAAVIAGCQTAPVRDEQSPYFAPPAGSTLTLNRTLEVAGGSTRIYFQGGKASPGSGVLSFQGIDQYYPNCYLQMRSKSAGLRTLEPVEFRIERVERREEWVMSEPVRLAALRFLGGNGGNSNGGDSQIYRTVMYLQAQRYPDVWRMSCQHWEEPYDAQHLTVRQIRDALGDVFTLKLAAP